MKKSRCPVCGNETIEERFDVCPVCRWEYDPYDIRNPELVSACNRISLARARAVYRRYGVSDLRYMKKRLKQ